MSETLVQIPGEPVRGLSKSLVVKHAIIIGGHKASVCLEDAFWKCLKEIASHRGLGLSELVTTIDSGRTNPNLSSALRLFVLDHYRAMAASAVGAQK